MEISITPMAAGRHFGSNPEFAGTKIGNGIGPGEFISRLKETVREMSDGLGWEPEDLLVEGYAPFCKHLFVLNWTGCLSGGVPITDENRHLLRTEYKARRPTELPVLKRYFSSDDVEVPEARVLDVILYTTEQLRVEGKEIEGDWAIVSINGQMAHTESPMCPATLFRNALGVDEGGSGVALDREKYAESVEYWSQFATVK
tara:strand:- start:1044 stop:1646 length:603 start_codon:yes stop_codon:yes gene_type:complete